MESEVKFVHRWGRPLNIALLSLGVFVVVVASFYFSIFNNGISKSSDNWSNFGTFVGGLIGPAISLVTLIALLRTIDLQLDQSAHFVEDGRSARLSEFKASQLRLLDQQILMYERMIDRYDTDVVRISEYMRRSGSARTEDLNKAHQNLATAEREIKDLIQLSVEVSLMDFDTVDELREKVKSGLLTVNSKIYNLG